MTKTFLSKGFHQSKPADIKNTYFSKSLLVFYAHRKIFFNQMNVSNQSPDPLKSLRKYLNQKDFFRSKDFSIEILNRFLATSENNKNIISKQPVVLGAGDRSPLNGFPKSSSAWCGTTSYLHHKLPAPQVIGNSN